MAKKDGILEAPWIEELSSYGKIYKGLDNKREWYVEYRYYYGMINRATNSKYKSRFPTYEDVVVSDNFMNYNYFVDWSRKQKGFNKKDWVLDKDVLYPNNKEYSEKTCVFIPNKINAFFTFRKLNNKGMPTGVTWCESENKYKAYCSQLNGKNKNLGRFDSEEEAFQSYRLFKNSLALTLLDEYKYELDERVVESLYKFDVQLYIEN